MSPMSWLPRYNEIAHVLLGGATFVGLTYLAGRFGPDEYTRNQPASPTTPYGIEWPADTVAPSSATFDRHELDEPRRGVRRLRGFLPADSSIARPRQCPTQRRLHGKTSSIPQHLRVSDYAPLLSTHRRAHRSPPPPLLLARLIGAPSEANGVDVLDASLSGENEDDAYEDANAEDGNDVMSDSSDRSFRERSWVAWQKARQRRRRWNSQGKYVEMYSDGEEVEVVPQPPGGGGVMKPHRFGRNVQGKVVHVCCPKQDDGDDEKDERGEEGDREEQDSEEEALRGRARVRL